MVVDDPHPHTKLRAAVLYVDQQSGRHGAVAVGAPVGVATRDRRCQLGLERAGRSLGPELQLREQVGMRRVGQHQDVAGSPGCPGADRGELQCCPAADVQLA